LRRFSASIEKIINTGKPGILLSLALLPLTAASFIYALIITIRSSLYKLGILKSYHADCKVITVGNLTVGGTGKTPTVCMIAEYLKKEGIKTAVVCRGYRGKETDTPQIVSDGKKILSDSESAGDEAYMLAKKLSGIPVIAGKDRVAASKLACKHFNTEIIILDDGFQHLRLKRDIDVVLINSSNPFGNGFLLPRGILREPLKALKRAGIVLLTKTDPIKGDRSSLENRIRVHNRKAPIFNSFYKPANIVNFLNGKSIPVDFMKDKKIACFCSIGDPESFIFILEKMGLTLSEKIIFPDHHQYSSYDYNRIKKLSEKFDYLITTEKDIAKITPDMIKISNLSVLEIEEIIDNTERFFKKLTNLDS